MKAIYKRELGSYFQSMTGYLFISVLTAVAGIYFMAYNLNAGYPYFSYALSGTMFILIISICGRKKEQERSAAFDITGDSF